MLSMRMSEAGHALVHLILGERGMSWRECRIPIGDGKVITRHYFFDETAFIRKEEEDGFTDRQGSPDR